MIATLVAAHPTAATAAEWTGHDTRLVVAALVGIAVIVLLITWLKVHPFIALILGSGALGVVAGYGLDKTITSFGNGVGSTTASVGVLIALGAMIGRLLADSGGADRIVDTILGRSGERSLPWAMALTAALLGLPLFFEVGVVLLVPVVLLVAKRANTNLIRIGIPALAGLSVLHGLVPPHPGPLIAISAVKAPLGLTLGLGILVAIPTVAVAGPIYGRFAARFTHAEVPEHLLPTRETVGVAAGSGADPASRSGPGAATRTEVEESARRPAFAPTLITILLPVILMLGKAVVDILKVSTSGAGKVLDFLGTPTIALLITVIVGMFTLGTAVGFGRRRLSEVLTAALPPIAGILLIVAAGGGFKQTLVDAGVGKVIANAAHGANFSALLLGWLIAVGIRVATGSATVATISAAGIVAPLAAGLDPTHAALLALAVGAGSLFFSHVNDAGFWLVKEYFGMTVGDTIKSWSIMETIISVVALVLVLLLGALL